VGALEKVERTDVITIKEIDSGVTGSQIDMMLKKDVAERTPLLRQLNAEMVERIVTPYGGRMVDLKLDPSTEWAAVFEPLKGFKIYFVLQRYQPEFEDEIWVFFGKELVNLDIPINDAYDWMRLCANVLERGAHRLLGK